MNNVHDMGGMDGFGAVPRADDVSFHAPWQRRADALGKLMRAQGFWSLPESRYAKERLAPLEYLQGGYWEHRVTSMKMLTLEKGLLTSAELTARMEQLRREPGALLRLPRREDPELLKLTQRMTRRAPKAADPVESPARQPRFRPGDPVLGRNMHPRGHTRIPRYARGRQGVIHRIQGIYPLPESLIAGHADDLQHMYSVRFAARELWGNEANPNDAVYLDLWEDYLQPC